MEVGLAPVAMATQLLFICFTTHQLQRAMLISCHISEVQTTNKILLDISMSLDALANCKSSREARVKGKLVC